MNNTILNKREEAFVIIFYFFIVPILLLYFNFIPTNFRLFMLLFICLLLYQIVDYQKWSKEELGMFMPDKKSTKIYLFFTSAMVAIFLFVVYVLHKTPSIGEWWESPSLMFLFIPISFLQEFAFRSFLFPLLKRAFSTPFFIISVDTLLFAFLHIIYQPLGISLTLALVSGLLFAIMYYKYPNFWLISISHSLLNLLAVIFGFFLIK